MEIAKAQGIAQEIRDLMADACARIEIAGSIRRQKPDPHDIELLCIPHRSDLGASELDRRLARLMANRVLSLRPGKRGITVYGRQNKLLQHVASGIGVDVFITSEDRWWVSLVVRTGGKNTNMRIATAALAKGWHLEAYGRGFITPQGEVICRSEREVFELVGLEYLEPWERA